MDCIIFLLSFPDATRMSVLTVSFSFYFFLSVSIAKV